MLYDELYDHQKKAVDFCLSRNSAALFIKQRLGKTYITCAVIEELLRRGPFFGLLVVPLTNKESTWMKLLKKKLKGKLDVVTELPKRTPDRPTLVLMHYEQASPSKMRKKLGKRKWTFACMDESQRLKARGSSQSRLGIALKHVIKRMILTGTPLDGDEIDIWGQFRFVAPQVFGTKWKDFDRKFLRPTGYMGYKRKFRKAKKATFEKLIAPHVLAMDGSEVGMEEPKVTKYYVELTKEEKSLYNRVDRDGVALWRGHTVAATMRITQNVVLQQITGGFVKDMDGVSHRVGSAKLDKLAILLKKLPKPLVVFCKYRKEVNDSLKLARELGYKASVIRGGSKNKKLRPTILRKFQEGAYDVLVCQIRTGGVGVDLYRSNNAIFYSISYSYIDFDQAKARINCLGKKEIPQLHLLIAKNTIDEDLYGTILLKKSVSNKLLNTLRKRRKNGKRTQERS